MIPTTSPDLIALRARCWSGTMHGRTGRLEKQP